MIQFPLAGPFRQFWLISNCRSSQFYAKIQVGIAYGDAFCRKSVYKKSLPVSVVEPNRDFSHQMIASKVSFMLCCRWGCLTIAYYNTYINTEGLFIEK